MRTSGQDRHIQGNRNMSRAIHLLSCAIAAILSWAPAWSEEPAQPPEKAEAGQEEAPVAPEAKAAPKTAGFVKYMEFLGSKYIAPEKPGDGQAVEVKFNLSTDIPKGTKINFIFEFNAVEIGNMDYVLKDENRKDVTVLWKPKTKLATGDYFLRTKIVLKDQTPAVAKIFRDRAKRFPPEDEPWTWYFANEKTESIKVGAVMDAATEQKAICEAYTAMMDELVANLGEFVAKMEKVKKGEELVNGGALDVEKFTAYVGDWRKKQGQTQFKITMFQVEEPDLFQKSMTAHANLLDLGRMVSKRAWQVQGEVLKQYGVTKVINPSPKGFDRVIKYATHAEALNARMDKIHGLVCPQEATEEGEKGKEGEEGKEGTKAAAKEPAPAEGAEGVAEKAAKDAGTEGDTPPEKPSASDKPKTKKKR